MRHLIISIAMIFFLSKHLHSNSYPDIELYLSTLENKWGNDSTRKECVSNTKKAISMYPDIPKGYFSLSSCFSQYYKNPDDKFSEIDQNIFDTHMKYWDMGTKKRKEKLNSLPTIKKDLNTLYKIVIDSIDAWDIKNKKSYMRSSILLEDCSNHIVNTFSWIFFNTFNTDSLYKIKPKFINILKSEINKANPKKCLNSYDDLTSTDCSIFLDKISYKDNITIENGIAKKIIYDENLYRKEIPLDSMYTLKLLHSTFLNKWITSASKLVGNKYTNFIFYSPRVSTFYFIKETKENCIDNKLEFEQYESRFRNLPKGTGFLGYYLDDGYLAHERKIKEYKNLCIRNASRLCHNIEFLKNISIKHYLTTNCEIREVTKKDIENDMIRWRRAGHTEASILKHSTIIDDIEFCEEMHKSGWKWEFSKPTVPENCTSN